jgi:uncharacterized protein (TIGR02099 family)
MVKKRARWAVKKFWGSFAIALILAAVVIQVGRLMAPMVSENRQQIAEYFSGQLGVDVSIGELEATWEGLRPQLEMADFSVHDKAGAEVVRVKHAVAQIDLLKSLWDFNLRMWRVELNEVQLSLVQHEAGWGLSGLAGGARDDSADSNPLDVFLIGRYISLSAIEVDFEFTSGRKHVVVLTDMLMQNDGEFHRISASMDSFGQQNALALVYEGVGDPRQLEEFSGQGYLELNQFPLESAVALFSETAAEKAGIKSGVLSTKLWLNSSPDSALSLAGDLAFERPQAKDDGLPQKISTQLLAHKTGAEAWQLSLPQAKLYWSDRVSEALDLQLNMAAEQWQLKTHEIDLAAWVSELRRFPDMPEAVTRILGELNPSGRLQNVHLNIPPAAPKDFDLRANLSDVSIDAWKGAPAVASLSGYIQANALSGMVEIDSPDAFFMHFPTVYHQGFNFQRAQGQVGWTVNPEDNQVYVNSGQLTMEGDLGLVNGYFYLDAPLQRNSRPLELVLQIGLQDGAALDHKKLVPYVVPESLNQWLGASIVDGKVPDASFVMQGYFGADASNTRSVQVGLNLQQAQLQYDPSWPALRAFDGYIEIDSPQVDGWIDRGHFLKTDLLPSYIHIENHASGQGSLLSIQAAVEGDASSGMDVLTDTPLRDSLGDAFDHWALSGDLQAAVDLEIPLQAGLLGHHQQVDVHLNNASLSLNDLDLDFHQLQGALSFNDREGLSAEGITGLLWQQPLSVTIDSRELKNTPTKDFVTDIGFEGPLDFSALANWSRRPEVSFISGVSPAKGVISVGKNLAEIEGEAASVVLKVRSSLLGSAIELPAPFGKNRNESRPLEAEIAIAAGAVGYKFDYNDQVSVALLQPKSEPVRGTVALNKHSQLGDDTGILLQGDVPMVDGRQWWPVVERYQALSDELSSSVPESTSLADASAALSGLKLDLTLGQFFWDELILKDVHLGGGQSAGGWNISVDDDVLAGEIVLSDSQPIALNAQYIRWPMSTVTEEGSAALEHENDSDEQDANTASDALALSSDAVSRLLAEITPADIAPVDLVVQELLIGGEDYGYWSTKLRPEADAIVLRDIVGHIRGVDVSGLKDRDGGANLVWRQQGDKHHTTFEGRLAGGNLEDISAAWALPAMLDSDRANVALNLQWTGNPADFSLLNTHGDLSLAVKRGRFYRSTDQATSALLRLVGLFNFDSWVRRLQLDFSDVYKGGTPYEKIEGKVKIDQGILYLTEPITVTNTSSRIQMGGKISLLDETLDASLVATLPVGGNATLITALAAGLPAAAGVYAVSKIFKKQVERVASVSYTVQGPWSEPEVSFDRLFDNKAAKDAAKDSRREADKQLEPIPAAPP